MKVSAGIFIIILLTCLQATAQNEVAIGSNTTKSNAILWLNGNGSQGLILPVVTNKTSVSNPDKGMIVFDDSDGKVWYRNANAWVEVGGGSSTTENLNLQIQGNQLQLRDGTTILNSVNIAGGTQSNGAFMVFSGGSWQFATLSGDVSGANGSLQVNGIKGKTIATLPASAQALVYDPAANSNAGGWVFQSLSSGGGGTVTNVTGTPPISITNPATTPIISIANAGISNTLLAADAVTTAKIQDGTITGADIGSLTITGANIAASTITTDKISGAGANSNDVLLWDGNQWKPSGISTGGVTQINTANGLTGGPITTSGTISIASGGVGSTELADNAVVTNKLADNSVITSKINNSAVDNTKLADGAVTTTKIQNEAVTGDKIAQNGALPGYVLKWNGNNWSPDVDATGGVPTLNNGQILIGDGTVNSAATLNGDATIAGGTLTINPISGGTGGKITDASITSADLANGAVTGGTGGIITDGSITGADLATNLSITTTGSITVNSPGVIGGIGSGLTSLNASNISSGTLALGRITPSATNGQVLTTVAGVPTWADGSVGTVTSITAGNGLTGGTITNSGTIAVDAGTTANKIVQLDGTGKLPAVDGSQLINLPVSIEVGDISDVIAGTGLTGGATTGSATLNVDVGTTANKIVQLDGTGKLPAIDGSQLTNMVGDISGVVAGTGLTGGAITGSATLNVDVGTTANKIVQLDGTGKLPAIDGSQLTNMVGDISGVVAGTGLTGGAITGSATLNVDVGTTANKIVQLDGTGKLPAVDGSQLINLPVSIEVGDISDVIAGTGLTGGAATGSATLNVDVGTTANKIVQLDGTGKLPAIDGSQLTNMVGDISDVVAGTGLTGGATIGSATLNVDVGNTANKIVQLDGTGKLPAVDGSQLSNLNATNISSGSLALARITPSVTNGQVLTTVGGVTTWQTPAADVDAQDLSLTGTTLSLTNDASTVTLGGLSILNSVTTNEVADLTITNADISGTAAIAGGKITPAFGDQNISTTGTLSAGATTVSGLTIGTSVWPLSASGVLTNDGTGTLSWGTPFTNPMTTAGDIIYGGASGAATRLAGATGILKSNGTIPAWGSVDLAGADVGGILGVANGGTGRATWDGLLLGTGATISDISTGTTGQILKVAGTTPSWQDFLVTSAEITDLSIVNADVNTNAAIDGTKITPAFGAQDISTSGDLSITGNAVFSSEVGIVSGALPGTSLFVGDGTTRSAAFDGDVLVNGSLAVIGTLGITNDALFAAGNTAGINGQVLTSQGNGVAPIWKDVSVFSTLNTIPKGNGTTLAASQIFDDGTNVGIGTITPTARLHVQGPGNFDIANTEGDFKVGNGTHRFKVGVAYAGGGAGDVYMGPQGGTSRLFIGGGTLLTDFQTITVGGGNVGIGNTAPSAKLDIVGTVKIVDGTQQNGYVLTSDANGLASWKTPAAVTGWGTTGNAGITDANFIGPNTSVPFNIKINSIRAGRVDPTNQDTFFGYEGGRDNISGTNSKNTAFGGGALRLNKYGFYNTAIGQGALYNMISTAGASYNANNTAVGFESLYVTNNSTATSVQGVRNTAIGSISGHDNVTGNENVFVGYGAGANIVSGSNNVFIGFNSSATGPGIFNSMAIGSGASVNANNKIVLGNASATTVGGYGAFTNYSDRRLKENIKYSDDLGLNFILQLKTATYNYKSDTNKRHRNGMIAQDVEEIIKKLNVPFSGLIIDDDAERTLNLSYSEFVMPLINSVQEQQKMIDEQKSEIEKLKAQLSEKDGKLNSLEGSVSSMKDELESIKRVLGIEAKAKTAGKK